MVGDVLVPFVDGMLHPATAGWAAANGAQFVALPAGDNRAYAEVFAEFWGRPGDLLLVEQDNVPPAGWPPECSEVWCAASYLLDGWNTTEGLGCVRFSAALKARHPWLGVRVGLMDDLSPGSPGCWRRLDVYVVRTLRALGYRVCVHGCAEHLHAYR